MIVQMPILPTLAILPSGFFDTAPQWLLIVIIIFTIAALVRGADWMVESIVDSAQKLGLPKIIIAATVVAMGTTSPEAAVSVLAAIKGNAGLALGNGVGSVIVDTGLTLGLGCLLTTLPVDKFLLRRQGVVQLGVGVLLALICYVAWAYQGEDAILSRAVGAEMIFLLAVYMVASVRWHKQRVKELGRHNDPDPSLPDQAMAASENSNDDSASNRSAAQMIFWGVFGLLLVIFAADAMVQSASRLATHWGVPETVIAGTIVAFGTSVPELVVGMTALAKGHKDVLIGSVIGADILNILFVIGASALASPLPIAQNGDMIFLTVHLPALLAVLFLFRIFTLMAIKRGSFSRWMGVPLIGVYIAYVALQYIWTLR